jgi:hypothetical protein
MLQITEFVALVHQATCKSAFRALKQIIYLNYCVVCLSGESEKLFYRYSPLQ